MQSLCRSRGVGWQGDRRACVGKPELQSLAKLQVDLDPASIVLGQSTSPWEGKTQHTVCMAVRKCLAQVTSITLY